MNKEEIEVIKEERRKKIQDIFYNKPSPSSEIKKDEVINDLTIRGILKDSNAAAYIAQDKVRLPLVDFINLVASHDLKSMTKKEKKEDEEVIIRGKALSRMASCRQKIDEQEYIIIWVFAATVFGMLIQRHLNVSHGNLFIFTLGVAFFFLLMWANKYFYDFHRSSHNFFNSLKKKEGEKKPKPF